MSQRALVVGSEGNIGTPLVQHLKASGWDVLESDIRPGWRDGYVMADISHPVDLLPAFDWKPEVVFLLSAMVSRVTCEQASSLAIATNLGGVNNVLQLAKRAGAKVVFFSTSEVYGPGLDRMDEQAPHPRPNNRYGLSKLLGEQLVEYEVRTHGLKAISLRPFMVYDENEDLGDHRSAMIRFTSELALGRPIEVHTGSARSWLHISDAVRAIEAAVRLPEYSVINIGHPDVVPIATLADMVRRELGAAPSLVREVELPARMTSVKRPVLDRMRTLLGVEPTVSLADGVSRVCRRVRERLQLAGRLPTHP
ncbi:MAG: nucleoside-diphosphate sugar epimerase [Acidobacteria bacterium RIFCSPLOWO2_12_FULL_66_10]|nr:MAG: nucleoside-diphosphate sugar epimerase [Acidobacteria bacterium RIFCSPLOWO2_12_FULL_66_10]